MSSDQAHRQVFHDPERKRWRRVRGVAAPASATLTLVFAALLVSIIINPILPHLGLKALGVLPRDQAVRPLTFDWTRTVYEHRFRKVQEQVEGLMSPGGRAEVPSRVEALAPAVARPVAASAPTGLLGFYVNWSDASFASLRAHIHELTRVVPEWYHATGPNGAVIPDDAFAQAKVIAYVNLHRPGLKITPLVNNYDGKTSSWDGTGTAATLHDPLARGRLIESLFAYVTKAHLAGINIDFENLPASAHRDLVTFMGQLHRRFSAVGLEVSEDVPPADPAFDYVALAKNVDYLIVMAYDESSDGSGPGPVAGQAWFATAAETLFDQLGPSKVVVALGSYGYDWVKGRTTQPLDFATALLRARQAHATITLDPATLNPEFGYVDGAGGKHHIWLLDAVTAYNEIAQTARFHPRGYALWRLGSEDPSVWSVFRARDHLGRAVTDSLKVLDDAGAIAYQGSGEVFRVVGSPRLGKRDLALDPASGLISREQVTVAASPFVIQRWGGSVDKRLALTFDDGPDPTWTPKVLDVLARERVHATFFVIGQNGAMNPDVMARTVAAGHEIGNHTFTHPDVSAITPTEFGLQLDSTERLFESRLGIRSLLFRPPYGEDIQPQSADQARPLVMSSAMGYYTVGMGVDPEDWARPGVRQIVDQTVAQVLAGKGHVILLHDAGGDRSETVAALPQIIERLRARGYSFVTVSDLLGVSRQAVNAPILASDQMVASVDDIGFALGQFGVVALQWVMLVALALGALRLVAIGTAAFVEWRRSRKEDARPTAPGFAPTVAVLVPTHNEVKVVDKTIETLLASDYPDLRIVTIDDGSTDGTHEHVVARWADESRVTALFKPNGGKASALNMGIAATDAEIVVGVDADTVFLPDTVSRLVRHFSDPTVGAVAGNAKVGNRVNLLTHWQAIEYITNQNLDRRAFDLVGCISVVPGAVGAWRRALVVELDGFSADTLAEDADLTLSVLRSGSKVRYEDEAIAYTEAPDTVGGLLRQRYRWVYGTFQTWWKHRDVTLRPRYGSLGFVGVPNVLLFQVIFPVISPVVDLVMTLAIVQTILGLVAHPGTGNFSTATLETTAFYWALFIVMDTFTVWLAFRMDEGKDRRMLWTLPWQRLFYRQLMYVVVSRSVWAAMKGIPVGWHRQERKATVAVQEPGAQ